MFRPASITLIVLAAAVPASADDTRQQVAALVEQLDADTRAARKQAEHDLLQLGPAALPHLPAPELLSDASLRETVRRIRLTLERRKAQESVQPSRVTLEGTFTLDEVLVRIARQTGNPIDTDGLPDELLQKRVDISLNDEIFWKAVDRAAEAAGLRIGSDGALLVPDETRDKAPLRVAYSGPFRLAVLAADVRPLAGDDAAQLLRFRIALLIEPRLRPLFLKFGPREVAASAPESGMLEPFSPEASYELPLGEGSERAEVRLDYRLPADADVSQAALQGRMMMLVAAGSEEIAFSDPFGSKGVAKRRGGVTVTLEEASFRETNEGDAVVEVAVSYDTGGPAFESHRTWIFHNQAWLQAPDRTRVEPSPDFATRRQTDGAVVLTYKFEDLQHDAGEYTFAYVAPTLLINVPVEIDLAKIPLATEPGVGTNTSLKK